MIQIEYVATDIGDRHSNLDRHGHFSSATWSFSYLLDGFREVEDHFVYALEKALVTGVQLLESPVGYDSLCALIDNALTQVRSTKGAASAVFYLEALDGAGYLAAGDTRIYWLDQAQRTVDHSRAQDYIDNGRSPRSSLSQHPLRNQLTRSLSAKHGYSLLSSIRCDPLGPGEKILLCTDGFWRGLTDPKVFACRTTEKLKAAYDEVTADYSKERDNCSVALLKRESLAR
jgi:serine/threonine protein phosphatase PrpC